MLNTQQLLTFVTVVTEGSMKEAASKLQVTQPAISQQIRQLEEYLGVELLIRNARLVKPTIFGEVLFDHARRILQHLQQTEVMIKSLISRLQGHINISTIDALGIQWVAPVISRFLRFHPQVTFSLMFCRKNQWYETLMNQKADWFIIPKTWLLEESKDNTYVKQLLFEDHIWLVVSGKDLSCPDHIQPHELNMRPFLKLIDELPEIEAALRQIEQNHGIKIKSVLECNNLGTLKRIIEQGLGWGFLPSSNVSKQVHAGRLKRVFVQDWNLKIEFYSVFSKDLPMNKQQLIGALQMAFEGLKSNLISQN